MIVSKIINYIRVARAQVLFMPCMLIICSFLYSKYHNRIVEYMPFVCVSISILLFNIAVNTISEYRDCKRGIDDVHSPGTKYRLVSGIVPQKHVLIVGIFSFIMASLFGIYIILIGPKILMVPGIIAASIVLFYSEKPFGLKYHALGELCVFLIYGPLIFSSCIISLTHSLLFQDILFSIPFGIFTVNVILANNIRDYSFEKEKTVTLPIKYGLKFAYFLLFFITHLAFLVVPFLIYMEIMPKSGILSFLAYPLIFLSIKRIGKENFIDIFGIMQVLFTLLICLAFLAQ